MRKYLRKQLMQVLRLNGGGRESIGYVVCDSLYPLTLWMRSSGKGYVGKHIVYKF